MTNARPFLPGYAVFAAMLFAAGLPIYIHAPKYYDDSYGVGIASIGLVLGALRFLDVVQDPFFGWLSERLRKQRQIAVAIAAAVLGLSMVGLFAVEPPVAPLLWFALKMTGLFSSFSFLSICFYAQGVRTADRLGASGHTKLAGWRETGALIGICLGAVAPTVFASFSGSPFALFAAGFVGLCVLGAAGMWRQWQAATMPSEAGFREVLADDVSRRLLLIAFVNAAPVAVSSTLFLFFVESRLDAPGWEGILLLLFFVAAAMSAPIWSLAAARYGAKNALLSGMVLAIAAFAGAIFLGSGDVVAFAVVCFASGAALGADLTLLPAIFARRMARVAPDAGQAFGLWNFVSKLTLAFAAVTLLPLLEASGFSSGAETNPPAALTMLTVLYALVPCALKLIAIALLAATPLKET